MAEKQEREQRSAQQRNAEADAGAEQVQERVDQEQEQGYVGRKVDPTPNENYTVAGVTSGAPTPETDPALAAEVGSRRFEGGEAQESK